MKKLLSIFICFAMLLSFSLSFIACENTPDETGEEPCEHTWVTLQSTQEKTVYECEKCKTTKEYCLVFDKPYTYTKTEIIIPESLTLEELKQTLPINSYAGLPLEIMEQVGTIDTVEKFKIVLNALIKTGDLNFKISNENGSSAIEVQKPFDKITVSNEETNYVLTVGITGYDDQSVTIEKENDTPNFLVDGDYSRLRFMDGKIQYSITYLKGIEIIFNFEIV